MRIDVTQKIMGLDDKPFLTGEIRQVPKLDDAGRTVRDDNGNVVTVPEQVEMTLRYLLVSAYANISEKTVSLADKVARGAMATKIHKSNTVDFSVEEIVKVKELLNQIINSPIVSLRVLEIIDPDSVPKEPLAAVPDDTKAE